MCTETRVCFLVYSNVLEFGPLTFYIRLINAGAAIQKKKKLLSIKIINIKFYDKCAMCTETRVCFLLYSNVLEFGPLTFYIRLINAGAAIQKKKKKLLSIKIINIKFYDNLQS